MVGILSKGDVYLIEGFLGVLVTLSGGLVF